jgi:aspartate/methionine/tyrosine aminotransferase
MTRIGAEVGGINLAQGLPDFEPPKPLVTALKHALARPGLHQYTFPWGAEGFRQAIARKCTRFNGFSPDPDKEITVTCGVSEAACAAILALTEPGDEVVILEPWYENYLPACVLAGVKPRFVPLSEPSYALDAAALARAMNSRTRLILVNTPANPSGRVFTREELTEIASLCQRHGVIAVTDEIYEHIWSEGHPHVSLASLPGMAEWTVTLSGLGKSYAVTGWRVGWAIASERLTALIRKVHDYLTICAPSPFQEAGVAALDLPNSYYVALRGAYARRRKILLEALARSGLAFVPPEGASRCPAPPSTRGAAGARAPGSTSPRKRRRCAKRRAAWPRRICLPRLRRGGSRPSLSSRGAPHCCHPEPLHVRCHPEPLHFQCHPERSEGSTLVT